MSKQRFAPIRAYKTRAFGWVSSIEFDYSVEMIDVTPLGAQYQQKIAGKKTVSLDVVIEPNDDWIARVGEIIAVDEILGNESQAMRIVGPMIVVTYRTFGSIGGGLGAIVSLADAGQIRVDKADPASLVLRQRVEEIRRDLGLDRQPQ